MRTNDLDLGYILAGHRARQANRRTRRREYDALARLNRKARKAQIMRLPVTMGRRGLEVAA